MFFCYLNMFSTVGWLSPVARLTGSGYWGATGNLRITGETRETSPLHPTYEQRPAAGAGAEAQVWLRCGLGGRSRSQWTDDVLGGSQSRFSFSFFSFCVRWWTMIMLSQNAWRSYWLDHYLEYKKKQDKVGIVFNECWSVLSVFSWCTFGMFM